VNSKRQVAEHRSAAVGVGLLVLALGATSARAKDTFSIDYIVTIAAWRPQVASVRWELSGIDEVTELRLRYPADRLHHFRGTGMLEPSPDGLRWVPGGPYAHLTYRANINHVRGQSQRYDSYAGPDWIVTRARDLFPRITIACSPGKTEPAKSRARLIFRLPRGWHSATGLAALGPHTYRPSEPGKILDRPRGWFALGKFALDREEITGTMVQVARVPGSDLKPQALFHLLDGTLPTLKKLLTADAETVLLVSAPDPMWHGGISGAQSFFMHAGRPLRTPDKTSPYLHELFHVLQRYKPAADADWIEEGLAEFYSLELQRRAGLIDAADYARALGYFDRFGLWNVDLTQQQDNPATNNSAPLVMHALDQRIQRATAGKARLDDVVIRLARHGADVDTAHFRRVVNAVSGKKLTKFFERHVARGIPPQFGAEP
jgi:predicted metalloprotease with PDZ domain